jgi:hypothetical protein
MAEAYTCVFRKPEYLSGKLLIELSGDIAINAGRKMF